MAWDRAVCFHLPSPRRAPPTVIPRAVVGTGKQDSGRGEGEMPLSLGGTEAGRPCSGGWRGSAGSTSIRGHHFPRPWNGGDGAAKRKQRRVTCGRPLLWLGVLCGQRRAAAVRCAAVAVVGGGHNPRADGRVPAGTARGSWRGLGRREKRSNRTAKVGKLAAVWVAVSHVFAAVGAGASAPEKGLGRLRSIGSLSPAEAPLGSRAGLACFLASTRRAPRDACCCRWGSWLLRTLPTHPPRRKRFLLLTRGAT